MSVQQRIQPLALLLLSAVLCKNLHIARVRGRAVCRLASSLAAAQTLRHEAVLQIAEARAFLKVVFGQEHVPQPELPRPCLQVFHDLWVFCEALGGGLAELLLEDGVGGDAFFFDEFLHLDQAGYQ